jgi:AcrR family transcriptional regulator
MVRPRLVSDDVILAAAHAEFMSRGNRATTASIAAAAGISEAGLLKRFATKENLLIRAVMQVFENDALAPTFPKGALTQEALIELAESILVFYRRILPLAMLAHTHLQLFERSTATAAEMPPIRFRERLRAFFATAIGRGSAQSAMTLAMLFGGTLWQAAFFEHAFQDVTATGENQRPFLRELVSTIWLGLSPRAPLGTSGKRAKPLLLVAPLARPVKKAIRKKANK